MLARTLNFKFILLVLNVLVASAWAGAGQKYLYSFGGAGDDPQEKNIFVENFVQVDTFGKDNGWHRDTLFDGDQENDKLAVSAFLGVNRVPDFNSQNFKAKLQQILDDLHHGKITSKDKVLITINTHGAPPDGTDSHKVVCTDGNCDMKWLAPVLKELEGAGIKTAVMDMSCYSGQSLQLASDKTCVITGAGDDVALGFANATLFSHMHAGISLEQAFLDARKDPHGFTNMRISSPAGIATQKIIDTLAAESQLQVGFVLPRRTPICASPSKIESILRSSHEIQIKASETMPEARQYIQDSQAYEKIYEKARQLSRDIQRIEASHPLQNTPLFKAQLSKQDEFYKLTQGDVFFQSFLSGADSSTPLKGAALKTQRSAHRLFDKLYRSYKSQKENPCAEFIL